MVDAAATAASGGAPQTPKLSELMLAMDVVDTLRHHEGLVARELGGDARDDALKARLRQIYEDQGLEVSDRILEEGIQALKESRFVYTPSPPSFGRTMAGLWIRRGRVAVAIVAILAIVAALIGWQAWTRHTQRQATEQAQIELSDTLPRALSVAADAARGEARVPEAETAIAGLVTDGQAALARGDAAAAKDAIAKLGDLRSRLNQQYVLRVVSRPGEDTGVFRVPEINPAGQNYYLIVEAVAPDGQVLSLPIVNEETGTTDTVTKWGARVSEAVFDAVKRDKLDDGIVQNNKLGEKRRGALEMDFLTPVLGMITKW
ncbi:hypothetical protein ABID19_006437 [Mesorhizobium robiniae]|uniref:Anti-sigma factor n=1 Tax=Mesorhizobium robiniae TaxID=559315 RepID=A0ABV2GZA1_9HYPH